jgi:hypothetical protein
MRVFKAPIVNIFKRLEKQQYRFVDIHHHQIQTLTIMINFTACRVRWVLVAVKIPAHV